ncbi:MAG: hypothetical protein ABJE95_33590 [Byssovorax sp.]
MRRGFLLAGGVAAAALAGSLSGLLLGACDGRSYIETNPLLDAGPDVVEIDADAAPPPPIEEATKVDVLLVVDNSRNLEVAHQALAETVPYLVDRLLNPACVNGLGNVVGKPASPTAPCAVGVRDFTPVTDLHLGMITTSLGGHGADLCSPANPAFQPTQNDAAHLITRTADGASVVPTYQNQGFLAWDPAGVKTPPGEASGSTLTSRLVEMVNGAGEQGCGFESQLESVYRFLVDPSPYAQIAIVAGKATPQGIDATLLQNRHDFLRPDSALVILLLSDENDCSIRESGQFFLAGQAAAMNGGAGSFHLPRARVECAASPADPCCASCAQATPAGCPPTATDPVCQLPPPTDSEDPVNLRCFDQKRRYGIDFLYPIDRYVDGLTSLVVPDRAGNLVDNPLFVGNRSPKLVMFSATVGVPWQDLVKDPKSLASGYAPPSEIDWDLVIGDPASGVAPKDPLMIEAIAPRSGTSPRANVDLAPPDAPINANAINGHERVIADQNDLQYACIYPRQTPKACTSGACECDGSSIATNPICQSSDGSYGPVQQYARALPGIRELQVVKGLGDRASAASVCAPITVGASEPTFGYKPTVDAVLRALRLRIP